MQLRISSCKRTVFRKDLTRFAPLWVGWGLFLGLLIMTMGDNDPDFWFPSNIGTAIQVMGIFTCVYGLLAAQALFGDLFASRLCNGLHAMPLKRQHWYDVHLLAGIWFCLIPSAAIALPTSVWLYFGSAMANAWQIPLYWWAGTNLSYLFFFGLAVFCVMCMGNRIGMAVLYGAANFASVLVMLLVDSLYTPLLHGLMTPVERFTFFCPMWTMGQLDFIDCTRRETGRMIPDTYGQPQPERIGQFTLKPEGWNYLFALALLGIVLLIFARILYKKRRLECAGDFLALPGLAPLFQVVLTLMAASGFAAANTLVFGNSGVMGAYLVVGLTVGWFATKMLLARSTRVFRPKNWIGLAILAAVLAGSLFLTKLDPLGIVDWVPQTGQVRNATLQMSYYGTQYTTEDPEEIADFLRIHTLALEDKYTDDDFPTSEGGEQKYLVDLYLTYALENGSTAKRRYYISAGDEEGQIAEGYFSKLICILQHHTSLYQAEQEAELRKLAGKPRHIAVANRPVQASLLTEAFVDELLSAIAADCEAGTMAQNYAFHESFADMPLDALYLSIELEHGGSLFLHIYPECENTLAVLEKTSIPEDMRQNPQNYKYG